MTKKASSSFKEKLFKKRLGFIGIFVSIVVSLLVGGGSVYYFMNKQVKELETANQSLGKISSVYSTLYYNYYKQIPQKKLTDGAINGMISALGDPFSEYMSETESSNLNDTMSGSFGGIGTQVEKSSNAIKVIAPIAGTPASKAGIKANDLIVKINGRQTSGMTLNKAVECIRGKVGTKVTITGSNETGRTFDKTLVRAKNAVNTGHGNVGYLNECNRRDCSDDFLAKHGKGNETGDRLAAKARGKVFTVSGRPQQSGRLNGSGIEDAVNVRQGRQSYFAGGITVRQADDLYRAGKQFENRL